MGCGFCILVCIYALLETLTTRFLITTSGIVISNWRARKELPWGAIASIRFNSRTGQFEFGSSGLNVNIPLRLNGIGALADSVFARGFSPTVLDGSARQRFEAIVTMRTVGNAPGTHMSND